MARLILCACVFLLMACDVWGADRSQLLGYQQFKFGMSESQLRSMTAIDDGKDEEGGRRFIAKERVVIDGDKYKLSFLLKQQKLWRVNLDLMTSEAAVACRDRFDALFGFVKAIYGEPDQPPGTSNLTAITYLRGARFTFADTGVINVEIMGGTSTCFVRLDYKHGLNRGVL
jgi:hypothetical protein